MRFRKVSRAMNKYIYFAGGQLIICGFVLYYYSPLAYLIVLMIMVTHELGHYIFATLMNEGPEFVVADNGNPRILVKANKMSVFTAVGGIAVNLFFLPVFMGMGVMYMDLWFVALLIVGGALGDMLLIARLMTQRVVKGSNHNEEAQENEG